MMKNRTQSQNKQNDTSNQIRDTHQHQDQTQPTNNDYNNENQSDTEQPAQQPNTINTQIIINSLVQIKITLQK